MLCFGPKTHHVLYLHTPASAPFSVSVLVWAVYGVKNEGHCVLTMFVLAGDEGKLDVEALKKKIKNSQVCVACVGASLRMCD